MLYCLKERSISTYNANAFSTEIVPVLIVFETFSAAFVRVSTEVDTTSSSTRLRLVRCDASSKERRGRPLTKLELGS